VRRVIAPLRTRSGIVTHVWMLTGLMGGAVE
jgi:hypothetical protein